MAGPYLRGSGNRISVPAMIANEALFRLKHHLVFPRLASRNYEKYFADKIGDRITVKRPYQAKIGSGRTMTDAEFSSIIDKTVDIVVNKRPRTGLRYNDEEVTQDIVAFGDRYLQAHMEEMAYEYDIAGADELGEGLNYMDGTPGTGLTSQQAQLIHAHATEVAIPFNRSNFGIISPMDFASIAQDVRSVQLEALVSEVIRERYMGMLGNWRLFSSVHIPHLVVANPTGGVGTPLVSGGGQEGATLNTKGWTANAKVLNKGQLFKVAGVKEIQPRGRRRMTGRDYTFCCAEDVTAASDGTAAIKLTTELNAGTLTIADPGGGSALSLAAFQNVSATPAADAAITLIGVAGKSYRQGIFYERSALEYVNIQLEQFESFVLKGRAVDDETGLSVSLAGQADINTMIEKRRLDSLFGAKAIYPEIGIRCITGAIN